MSTADKTLILVYDELKKSGVLDRVAEVYCGTAYGAITLVVVRERFFGEILTVVRTSANRYYVFHNSHKYRAVKMAEVAPIVVKLVDKILDRYELIHSKERFAKHYQQRLSEAETNKKETR